MIALLKGNIHKKTSDQLILMVGGVGYRVSAPVSTTSRVMEGSDEVTLHIHTHVREDQFMLYGFLTQEEKRIFERLISISNIGPKMAMTILSGIEHTDLVQTIIDEDIARLSSIPGIGKKTAERIVIELKDKMEKEHGISVITSKISANRSVEDAISALVNLGYGRQQAEGAMRQLKKTDGASVGDLIKQALKVI